MRHISCLGLAAGLGLLSIAGPASAKILINQPFSSGSLPAGFTLTTANGGVGSFAGGNFDVSPFQTNGEQAFVSTTPTQTLDVLNVGGKPTGFLQTAFDVTFNTHYQLEARGQGAGTPIFTVYGGGNNALAALYFNGNGFFGHPVDEIDLGAGIEYGQGGQTVVGSANPVLQLNSNLVEGKTFHVVIDTTITNNGAPNDPTKAANYTIADTVQLTQGTTKYNLNLAVNGDGSSGYDPLHSTLNFNLGTLNFGENLTNPSDFTGNIAFGNLQVVPEPASAGLLVGGSLLGLIRRRRRIA